MLCGCGFASAASQGNSACLVGQAGLSRSSCISSHAMVFPEGRAAQPCLQQREHAVPSPPSPAQGCRLHWGLDPQPAPPLSTARQGLAMRGCCESVVVAGLREASRADPKGDPRSAFICSLSPNSRNSLATLRWCPSLEAFRKHGKWDNPGADSLDSEEEAVASACREEPGSHLCLRLLPQRVY